MNQFSNSRAGLFNATARAYGARNGDRPADGPPVRQPDDAPQRTAIAAAKRGEWDGIHYLYARHADDVFSCVLSIVREHDEAEDITQNVFRELVSEIDNYEERSMPFATWITRVARSATVSPAREEQR